MIKAFNCLRAWGDRNVGRKMQLEVSGSLSPEGGTGSCSLRNKTWTGQTPWLCRGTEVKEIKWLQLGVGKAATTRGQSSLEIARGQTKPLHLRVWNGFHEHQGNAQCGHPSAARVEIGGRVRIWSCGSQAGREFESLDLAIQNETVNFSTWKIGYFSSFQCPFSSKRSLPLFPEQEALDGAGVSSSFLCILRDLCDLSHKQVMSLRKYWSGMEAEPEGMI